MRYDDKSVIECSGRWKGSLYGRVEKQVTVMIIANDDRRTDKQMTKGSKRLLLISGDSVGVPYVALCLMFFHCKMKGIMRKVDKLI